MNNLSLPHEHQDKINFAVSNGLNANEWEFIEQVSGGLTGVPVYKIKVDDQFYVIKLENTEDKEFDLVRNYRIINAVSDQRICPKVYLADAKYGILLMEFIEPKRAESTPENVKKFATMIRELHDKNSFLPWKSVLDVFNDNYEKLPDAYKNREITIKCLHEIKNFQTVLFDAADIKSCHADLNPANVLFNGERYFFVDWQAASPQSLYYDLACVATWFYFYNESLCSLFLNAYFDREATEIEKAKYELMRIFCHIYFGVGFISLSLKSNSNYSVLSDEVVSHLPSFLTFMQAIGAGQVNLADANEQQKFGFIFLKTAESMIDKAYEQAYELLRSKK